jgi:L-lysine 2,3-aminomutase
LKLRRYVAQHPEVKDVLFTGGDPMVMPAHVLRRYIAPLLNGQDTGHLATVRIGTKSLSYWPYRYLSDPDSRALLDLFAEITAAGKHLTIQAHFTHPREVESPAVQEAIRVIRMTGAQIRCQSPLVRHGNDHADTWRRMWDLETRLGAVPYYM